jgi:hypothetical protein
MKIRLMIAVFIGLGIFGCATQQISSSSVTIFWIQGRVLDKESNFPLEGVNVYRRKTAFGNAPKATLDIVLSRDLYKTKTFHFKESELETDGLTFLIDLKDVYMIREME